LIEETISAWTKTEEMGNKLKSVVQAWIRSVFESVFDMLAVNFFPQAFAADGEPAEQLCGRFLRASQLCIVFVCLSFCQLSVTCVFDCCGVF